MNRFKNKNGDVSRYALACGYIQKRELAPNIEITLWHEGGPCFHVRAHDHNTHERIFWHATKSLTEARKVYRSGKAPQ